MKTTTCSYFLSCVLGKTVGLKYYLMKSYDYNLNILHLSYKLGIIGKKKLMITLLILITYTCICNTQGFVAEK